jgi:hypothetical protein
LAGLKDSGLRLVLGIFLILHGITHSFFPSFGTYDSWLLGASRGLAVVLFSIATALFVASRLALLLKKDWWTGLMAVAAIESLFFLMIFWEAGLIVGIAIDIALLALIAVPLLQSIRREAP